MAKIAGNMVGVPNPQSDWNQTDETKADYIKNKPNVVTFIDYATPEKAGVVKVSENILESGLHIKPDGTINILEAMEADLGMPYPSVITARNLDKAVKYVGDGYYAVEADVNRRTNEIEAIAKGRATGYVFDTVEDLDLWLEDESNISKLKLGDNLYIRAKEVPDYWWDGESKQQLETQKVDLTEYVKITDYATADKAGVVKVGNDMFGGLIMTRDGIIQIFEALEGDLGSNYSAVITTKILDKAVKFVGDGYYATAEEVGDISSALDELHAYAQALIGGAE